MNAATYDITYKNGCAIEVGATYGQTFRWKQDTVYPNLTTWTARMHIRRQPSSPSPEIELTTENGRITLGATGEINLVISSADTTTLKPGRFVYDLELVNGTTVYRFMRGSLEIVENITR